MDIKLLTHLLKCEYVYTHMHTPKWEETSKSLISILDFTYSNSKIAKGICLPFADHAAVLSEFLWVSFKALNNRDL